MSAFLPCGCFMRCQGHDKPAKHAPTSTDARPTPNPNPKRIALRCATPRERAEVARRIRADAEALGLRVRVEPLGAFKLVVEATEDVLDVLFVTKGN